MNLWVTFLTLLCMASASAESISTAELTRLATNAVNSGTLVSNDSKAIVFATEGDYKAVLVSIPSGSDSYPTRVSVAPSSVASSISSDFTHGLIEKYMIAFVNDKQNRLGETKDSSL